MEFLGRIKERLQPLALEMFGARVTRLDTASAYMCRQRIGSVSEKLSEHSFANALDISAFVTKDGRSIDVLTRWGSTARDRCGMVQWRRQLDRLPIRVMTRRSSNVQFRSKADEGADAKVKRCQ